MKTYIRLSGTPRPLIASTEPASKDWPRYERQFYLTRPVKKETALVTAAPSGMSVGALWRCCQAPVRLLGRVLLPVAAVAALTGTAFSLEDNEVLTVGAPMLSKDQLQALVDRMTMRQNNGQPKAKAQAPRKTQRREQPNTQGSGNQPPMVDGAALAAAISATMDRRTSASSASAAPASSAGSPSSSASAGMDATTGSTGVGANGSSNAAAPAAANSNTNTPAAPVQTTPPAAAWQGGLD